MAHNSRQSVTRGASTLDWNSLNHNALELIGFPVLMHARHHGFADWLLRKRKRLPARHHLFERYWPAVQGLTLLDQFRAESLVGELLRVNDLPGDVVECGSFSGGISLLMGLILRDLGSSKSVFICDSFAGLPPPDGKKDRFYQEGAFTASDETLHRRITEMGLDDQCVIVKGWFHETLPKLVDGRAFSLAHIDCDLYAPATQCLKHLYPRMTPGASLICDDYCDGARGVMRAVNDFAAKRGETVFLGPAPQAMVFPGGPPQKYRDPRYGITQTWREKPLSLSWAALKRYQRYQVFLRELDKYLRVRGQVLSDFVELLRTTGKPRGPLRHPFREIEQLGFPDFQVVSDFCARAATGKWE